MQAYRPQGYLRLEGWARLLAAELALETGDTEALIRHGRPAVEIFARVGCRLGMARAAALPLPDGAARRPRSAPAKSR